MILSVMPNKQILVGVAVVLLALFIVVTFLLPTKGYRAAPKEAMAAAVMRTIIGAEETYFNNRGRHATIQELIDANLLKPDFAEATPGYTFSVTLTERSYLLTTKRLTRDAGAWDFFATSDGIVRFSTDASAAPPDEAGMPVR